MTLKKEESLKMTVSVLPRMKNKPLFVIGSYIFLYESTNFFFAQFSSRYLDQKPKKDQ